MSLRALLAEASEPLPALVLVEVRIVAGTRRGAPVVDLPATVDLVVGLRHGDRVVGETLVGSAFFNTDVPEGIEQPTCAAPGVRPVRTGRRRRPTRILLGHPRAADDTVPAARPLITLLDESGTKRATAEVDVPPRGCVAFDVADLFPTRPTSSDPPGSARYHVRTRGRRLYGFHHTTRRGHAQRGPRSPDRRLSRRRSGQRRVEDLGQHGRAAPHRHGRAASEHLAATRRGRSSEGRREAMSSSVTTSPATTSRTNQSERRSEARRLAG